ncbi:hypothetical protein ACFQPA_06665 [Halomarina halobia]|uniref:Uncharacterized protein n=1 Tax=Halomarina halobia TaxID=3033386 RepID=A0ABD6A717_9EURY|nr:hypothetical protein [Halomarina sp. PSR21]
MPRLHEARVARDGERWVIRADDGSTDAAERTVQVTPRGQCILDEAGFAADDYLDGGLVAALAALDVLYTVDGTDPRETVSASDDRRASARHVPVARRLLESVPPADLAADNSLAGFLLALGTLDREAVRPFVEACCRKTPFDPGTVLTVDEAIERFARGDGDDRSYDPVLFALLVHLGWRTVYSKTVLYLDVAAGETTARLCRIDGFDYFVGDDRLWKDGLSHPLREAVPNSPLLAAAARATGGDVRSFFGREFAALAKAQAIRTLDRLGEQHAALFSAGLAATTLDVVALPAPRGASGPTHVWTSPSR